MYQCIYIQALRGILTCGDVPSKHQRHEPQPLTNGSGNW